MSSKKNMKKLAFPELPMFNDELVESCREIKDFRPIFFEIYKHIGIVSNLVACINKKDSSRIIQISNSHFGILIGLVNRCSRLMLANTVLASKGTLGETTTIIDRCILESAINVRWICKFKNNNSFERFITSSLKSDLELEKNIKQKINERKDNIIEIEERMLKSINRCIILSEIDRDQIETYQRFPNFETRIKQLEYENEELPYTVMQRIGSHHVHGTWTSLLTHYLEEIDGELFPRDNDVSIHVNQFISISLEVLEMLKDFLNFISINVSLANQYLEKLNEIRILIDKYRMEIFGNDFNEIKV